MNARRTPKVVMTLKITQDECREMLSLIHGAIDDAISEGDEEMVDKVVLLAKIESKLRAARVGR